MKGDEILKVTALVYFQEALTKQKYEVCSELIALAKKFGAKQSEITEVITNHLRGRKPGGGPEANRIKNLELLKEGQ